MSISHRIQTSIDAAACLYRLEREPKEAAADYVLRTLTYNIQMLYMPPGALLREPDIAARLGVSRTPVHEAVKSLIAAHLVYVAPKRATFVSLIDMDVHAQGRFARGAIEPLLIDQLQGRLTPEQHERFRANIDRQLRVAADGANPREMVQVDDEFHQLLYQETGNELVWEATRALASQFDRVRHIGFVLGYERLMVDEHDFILDILETGGVPLSDVYDMVAVHLRGYERFIDRLKQDHPDYFLGSGGYAETR
ncbi:GntR family transcriptional regulator [Olsenella sp. YH-ols2217]|uniref:GntR family transcriptional regulator n=1 Tax=Kribbibacterium absianum TaxID=3044210 RepID=A0ABT6ZKW0_9ACTN|nr:MULTISPECIES: GntR family transcriptional regulator [unclassified Olsenella]MDJ1122450.1 GntR family transcriptional regulator [Olsenella sp. YH-ols2216]MDJ1129296.1 GntR family transcriptional regulator [Olsenella sp. YH-ols2217]